MGAPLAGEKANAPDHQLDSRRRYLAAAQLRPLQASKFQLNETTWTCVDPGVKARESIDASGNYIENAVSGKHIDHGTAVMKGGKACFTSAMTKDGECAGRPAR